MTYPCIVFEDYEHRLVEKEEGVFVIETPGVDALGTKSWRSVHTIKHDPRYQDDDTEWWLVSKLAHFAYTERPVG